MTDGAGKPRGIIKSNEAKGNNGKGVVERHHRPHHEGTQPIREEI